MNSTIKTLKMKLDKAQDILLTIELQDAEAKSGNAKKVYQLWRKFYDISRYIKDVAWEEIESMN